MKLALYNPKRSQDGTWSFSTVLGTVDGVVGDEAHARRIADASELADRATAEEGTPMGRAVRRLFQQHDEERTMTNG